MLSLLWTVTSTELRRRVTDRGYRDSDRDSASEYRDPVSSTEYRRRMWQWLCQCLANRKCNVLMQEAPSSTGISKHTSW